jgi:hypothetical protein
MGLAIGLPRVSSNSLAPLLPVGTVLANFELMAHSMAQRNECGFSVRMISHGSARPADQCSCHYSGFLPK